MEVNSIALLFKPKANNTTYWLEQNRINHPTAAMQPSSSATSLPFLDVRIPVVIQERSAVFQVTLAEVEQALGTNFMDAGDTVVVDNDKSHILASLGKGPHSLSEWLRVVNFDTNNTTPSSSSSSMLNMLGLTPETKLVVKISRASNNSNNNNTSDASGGSNGGRGAGCDCIACECNKYGTSPALSEFAALRCVLLQHLTAHESNRKKSSSAAMTDTEILSSPHSPLSYYPFPIPLGVAKFKMPTDRFKVIDSAPPQNAGGVEGDQQVVQGIFLVYKKACSMDRLYYDFPDGFNMSNQNIAINNTTKGGSGKYIGDEGLLGHWTAQLMRILDTLHTPRSIYPTYPSSNHNGGVVELTRHHFSVIHKDVKIKNILVSGTGYLHLVDFGCAVVVPSSTSSIIPGAEETVEKCIDVARQALLQTTGTVTTMAPELTTRSKSSSQSIKDETGVGGSPGLLMWVQGALMDVFGLGVVLMEMMNGRQTNGATESEFKRLQTLMSSKQGNPPNDGKDTIISFIQRMIQYCPLRRYKSCTGEDNEGSNTATTTTSSNPSISPMRAILASSYYCRGGSGGSIGTHPFPVQYAFQGGDHQHDPTHMEDLVGEHWCTAICPGFSEEVEEEVGMQTLGL